MNLFNTSLYFNYSYYILAIISKEKYYNMLLGTNCQLSFKNIRKKNPEEQEIKFCNVIPTCESGKFVKQEVDSKVIHTPGPKEPEPEPNQPKTRFLRYKAVEIAQHREEQAFKYRAGQWMKAVQIPKEDDAVIRSLKRLLNNDVDSITQDKHYDASGRSRYNAEERLKRENLGIIWRKWDILDNAGIHDQFTYTAGMGIMHCSKDATFTTNASIAWVIDVPLLHVPLLKKALFCTKILAFKIPDWMIHIVQQKIEHELEINMVEIIEPEITLEDMHSPQVPLPDTPFEN